MDPVSIGLSAATEIPKLVVGISEFSKANKALKALGAQKYPEYGISPEMQNAYQRAEAMSKYGYSPEEQAQFEQQLARNQSGTFQQATDMSGGNLSSAIGGVLQANQTDAINKFAAGGADLKRQNIQYADTLAQRLQSQRNLQTQSAIARRQMLEQAYGQAKSSALGNITSAFSGAGALATQGAMGAANPNLQTNPDGSFAGRKYDANGNVTNDYLNSAEVAPENVPNTPYSQTAAYKKYEQDYGLQ